MEKTLKGYRIEVHQCNLDGVNLVEIEYSTELDEDQILVKVAYAPVNPLDVTKLKGLLLKPPFVLGSECSGVVVLPEKHKGRKVTVSAKEGSFQSYVVATLADTIFFDDDADLSKIQSAYVNPLTAIGLLESAKEIGAKAFVNSAANSQLGLMLNRLAQQQGYEIINLVRGQERVQELKDSYGAKHVLDIEHQNFSEDLQELSKNLEATVAFDCYGGDVAGAIFNSLPPNSTQLCYGNLISPNIGKINAVQVRWANKTLRGFVLFGWLNKVGPEATEKYKQYIAKEINGTFATNVNQIFGFQEYKRALQTQLENTKSLGKILLKFL